MSAVADIRGLKRICNNCGSRFYDMNKRPIICPSCDTEFTGEPKVKGRRGRVAEKVEEATKGQVSEVVANDAEVNEDEDEDVEEDHGVEIVSLDDDQAMSDAAGERDDEGGAVDLDALEGGDLDDIDDVDEESNDLPDPDNLDV